MAKNKVVYNGETLIDLSSDTVSDASHIVSGYIGHLRDGTQVTGTGSGGGLVKMGVLRSDAELVQTWTLDAFLVEDLEQTIPSYTTTATTIKASETLGTYEGSPANYRYIVLIRTLTIPEYNVATGKGKQEYVATEAAYEWIYNPSGELASLDGSKSYGQYSQFMAYGICIRNIYWSSATAVGVYTSAAYGIYQTIQAPTISSNKTITIKSPLIGIRGHSTYLPSTYMNGMTDARIQYVIELWRIPVDTPNGWMHGTQIESILANVRNNGGKLT